MLPHSTTSSAACVRRLVQHTHVFSTKATSCRAACASGRRNRAFTSNNDKRASMSTPAYTGAAPGPGAGDPLDSKGWSAPTGATTPPSAGWAPPAGAGAASPGRPMTFKGSSSTPTAPTGSKKGIAGLANNAWGQQDLEFKYPKLVNDTEADVVVVGGGVAGLTTAYVLARAGKRVVVLEGRALGSGTSGRHPGDLSTWNNSLYSRLQDWYGSNITKQVAQSQRDALDFIQQLVETEGLQDCGFTRGDAYLLPGRAGPSTAKDKAVQGPNAGRQLLDKELSAAVVAGLRVEAVDLGGSPAAGGYGRVARFPGTATIQPLRYLQGLAEVLTKKYGVRIFEDTRVRKHYPGDKKLVTLQGWTVKANEGYVLTTATPITSDLVDSALTVLSLQAKQHARRRYVIGLEVPSGNFAFPKDSTFYDTEEPHHTVRLVPGSLVGLGSNATPKSGGRDVLLVAGEAHDQGMRPSEFWDVYGRLEGWAKERWQGLGGRVFNWSYQTFQSSEGLGLYGPDPLHRHVWVATGDCDQGPLGATLGGVIIASEILGWEGPKMYKDAYSPTRRLRGLIPLVSQWSPRYFSNTIQSVVEMLLPLPRYAGKDIEDITPGSGAMIAKGPLNLRKVAVYKDESGDVQQFSGLCPHLGCLLQWNPVEKEWNCPCHGSCFDRNGHNIGGPSTIDMTKLG